MIVLKPKSQWRHVPTWYIDAQTGVFMLLYLDLSYDDAKQRGCHNNFSDLREVIMDGAARRLRPKFMTFATTCIGLFPIMWATGTGSDVMTRIAAPMVGGIFTSFVLGLLIYPAVYEIWKRHAHKEEFEEAIEEVCDREPSIALLRDSRRRFNGLRSTVDGAHDSY